MLQEAHTLWLHTVHLCECDIHLRPEVNIRVGYVAIQVEPCMCPINILWPSTEPVSPSLNEHSEASN